MNTEINPNEKIVLALGFFDGVHLGHQELINATIKKAKELNCASGVMTFAEHPLTHIFQPTHRGLLPRMKKKFRL